MIAILSAYALVNFQIISISSITYLALNSTGAIGIVYISLKKKAYQPAALNVIWFIIAFFAIIKLFI